MKFQKKYMIKNWIDWSHLIHESSEDFYKTYSFYPNILQANNHTFSQFDFFVNEVPGEDSKVKRIDKEFEPHDVPHEIKLASFETEKYSIDFAVDETLNDKEIILIYDSDPDWDDGDNDILIDNPIDEFRKKYKRVLV